MNEYIVTEIFIFGFSSADAYSLAWEGLYQL